MSFLSPQPRRLAGAVVAGLALTLVPAATFSAGAAPVVSQVDEPVPGPVTNLRLDTTPLPDKGQLTFAWNPPAGGAEGYRITVVTPFDSYEDFAGPQQTSYSADALGDNTPTLFIVEPVNGDNEYGEPRELRAVTLGAGDVIDFTDTPGNTFEYQIHWLSSTGVTTGYQNGDTAFFDPSAPVLREQMAAFLYRLAVASGMPDDFPAPQFSPFTDVPTTHTFYREIAWLAETGITTGYSNGDGTRSFAPSATVLREQMSAFIYRAWEAGYTHGNEPASFVDTPSSSTFFNQIEWMALVDITTGYKEPNGTRTFRGSQPVLREQMAAFLYRAMTAPFDEFYEVDFANAPEGAPLNPAD